MKSILEILAGIILLTTVVFGVTGCSQDSEPSESATVETLVPMTKITRPATGDFYISNTEITYAKWYEVYQWAVQNGYVFQNLGREGSNGTDGAVPTENSRQPVTFVSWRDVVVWCNAASEMGNLIPYYYEEATKDFTDKTKVVRIAESDPWSDTNTSNIYIADWGEGKADKVCFNAASNGYRVPTEVEWEYAAKGGEDYKYSGSDDIDEVAWYSRNSEYETHDVGTKTANGYGLYDMSGNVAEWCQDTWSAETLFRSIRGGSCSDPLGYSEVTFRTNWYSNYGDSFIGFRVVKPCAKIITQPICIKK